MQLSGLSSKTSASPTRTPDGQINNRLGCAISPSVVQNATKCPARKNEFHQPFQRDLGRPVHAQKIIRFSSSANAVLFPSSCLMKRGVLVVTIRGVREAVDATASRASKRLQGGRKLCLAAVSDRFLRRTSGACARRSPKGEDGTLRTAKSCGSGTRCWCQVGGGDVNPTGRDKTFNPPTTVTRRIRRRGDHGISRKTIAQGMSDC